MLTPAWPSAGPTGGAGVALPAATCSLTTLEIFFAILYVTPPSPYWECGCYGL